MHRVCRHPRGRGRRRPPDGLRLLVEAVTRICAAVTKGKAAGGGRPASVSARSRQTSSVARERPRMSSRITGDLVELSDTAAGEAQRTISNAPRALRRQGAAASGTLRRAIDDLETLVMGTAKVIDRTRTRLAGGPPAGVTRLVSLYDPDARPIVEGRLGKPVEFGYKAQSPTTPGARARLRGPLRSTQRRTGCGTPRDRTATQLPAAGQVAHRRRRAHLPQTQLWDGPHPGSTVSRAIRGRGGGRR